MIKKLRISAVAPWPLLGCRYAAVVQRISKTSTSRSKGRLAPTTRTSFSAAFRSTPKSAAACHGLKFVPLRTLRDDGGPQLPEDQVRAYAERYEVFDAELDDFRPATPVDHFPAQHLRTRPTLA